MDARVQDTCMILTGLDPFGRVTSGFLRICGRAKKAAVVYKENSEIPSFTYVDHQQSLYDIETGQEIGRCSFDSAEYINLESSLGEVDVITKPERIVLCLALARHVMGLFFRSSVMLLEGVKSNTLSTADEWKRIGIAYVQYPRSIEGLRGQDWFADVLDQELTIV